jgi:Tfp pilus assembly ATPase PilU
MISTGLTIQKLLAGMKKYSASDLHIKPGIPPTYRVSGILRPIGNEPLSQEEADHLLDPIVPAGMEQRFIARSGASRPRSPATPTSTSRRSTPTSSSAPTRA